MQLFITGFGPFGSFTENPSSMLAEGCRFPSQVLEVSFDAVEEFLEHVQHLDWDALLCTGVSGQATICRIETTARNFIGAAPDIDGRVWGPGLIDPTAPPQLGGTLWRRPEFFWDSPNREPSVSAGNYLCNYLYFRALSLFPSKRIGFLHVPPLAEMPLETQQETLDEVLALLLSEELEPAPSAT